jgi:cytochrome c553
MAVELPDVTPEHAASEDRAFRRGVTLAVGAVLLVGIVLGFVVLPIVQGSSVGLGAWAAICRAVGVQPGTPIAQQPISTAVAHPVSQVSWGPATLGALRNANAAHGAEISRTCSACHGTRGVAPSALFPNLAGQSAFAIYKQLHDYRTGARLNDAMAAVVRYLDDQSVADVSVYYASREAPQSAPPSDDAITNLAMRGDPSRSIAACNDCHVSRPEAPVASPNLVGQHRQYLANQLQAFAHDKRTNDVYARMRTIAGSLTDDEMARLAAYYGSPSRAVIPP